VLIGEPGVGKTALWKHCAAHCGRDVPESLKSKRIVRSTWAPDCRRKIPRRVRGSSEGVLKEIEEASGR